MDDKIKVVFIIDVLENIAGGAERQIYELIKNINKEKFGVSLLILHQKEVPQEILNLNIEVKGLGIKRIYDFSGIFQGFKHAHDFREKKIDAIMTYHFSSDIWGVIFGSLAMVPLIISNRRDIGFWRKKLHLLCYKLINNRVNKILVVSEAVRQMVIKEEGVPEAKVKLIYNGVDLERFKVEDMDIILKKKELGLPENCQLIGTVANLCPIKGQTFLIEAASAVINKFPKAHFLLIGEGGLKETLQTQALALGIEKNVHFLGKRMDVPQLLKIMDICVLPSLSEGLSNALLEYMALGKPVIATNVGGNSELIKDKINGLLVKKANSKDLAEKINYLLENREERQRLGIKAKEVVKEKFSLQLMIKGYEVLFNSLMKETAQFQLKKEIRLYIKMIISTFIYYSRIFNFIKFLKRKKPIILCYHRVVEDFEKEKRFSLEEILVSKGSFIKQINFLKKHYNIISMDDFVEYLEGKNKLAYYSLLITFDDGYRDNYTIAYPILKKLALPATIFLTTDFIDSEKYPDWEKERPGKERLMLSWEEVNEMNKDGVSFATHTQSHLICNRSIDELMNNEISASRKIIKEKIGKNIEVFAFPKGIFNREILALLKKNGLKCTFSLDEKGILNVPGDYKNFIIKRIPINEGMYVKTDGIFSVPMFACGILNFFKIIR